MEYAEGSSEKTYYRPEDLGVVYIRVPVCDHDLFGRGLKRASKPSGAFLVQALTALVFLRNSLAGFLPGYLFPGFLLGLSLNFM